MQSRKLVVTHRGNLAAKYGADGVAAVGAAVAKLAAADARRGIQTHYVHLDDADEMKRYHSKVVSKDPGPSSCKRVIDKAFTALSPDYLVLLGSDDVLPHFRVPNPTFTEDADTDEEALTDNPYAASPAFNPQSRATYLVVDRVVGRIPDVPGATDPSALLQYLESAAAAEPLDLTEFDVDLLVCCDTWKKSGQACVAALGRKGESLFLSPPNIDGTAELPQRHVARLQMIKCHGAALDPHFYGQEGGDFPPVLFSSALVGATAPGTVVGAMCCYGASVYDPAHPAALTPGVPSIPTVYLSQAAAGFVGATGIAWVGVNEMACADLIVTRFLKNVMVGMSLGAALLDSKQRFLADIGKDGRMPDAAEEKTLLQFVLLGDPSLRAATSREERDAVVSIVADVGSHFVPGDQASVVAESGTDPLIHVKRSSESQKLAMAAERRSRRAYHFRTARNLRKTLPERTVAEPPFAAAQILNGVELAYLGGRAPVVHRVSRTTTQPQVRPRRIVARAATAVVSAIGIEEPEERVAPATREETLQYYWHARTPRERIIDATIVKVETDCKETCSANVFS